jgi:hypothetical protein
MLLWACNSPVHVNISFLDKLILEHEVCGSTLKVLTADSPLRTRRYGQLGGLCKYTTENELRGHSYCQPLRCPRTPCFVRKCTGKPSSCQSCSRHTWMGVVHLWLCGGKAEVRRLSTLLRPSHVPCLSFEMDVAVYIQNLLHPNLCPSNIPLLHAAETMLPYKAMGARHISYANSGQT